MQEPAQQSRVLSRYDGSAVQADEQVVVAPGEVTAAKLDRHE